MNAAATHSAQPQAMPPSAFQNSQASAMASSPPALSVVNAAASAATLEKSTPATHMASADVVVASKPARKPRASPNKNVQKTKEIRTIEQHSATSSDIAMTQNKPTASNEGLKSIASVDIAKARMTKQMQGTKDSLARVQTTTMHIALGIKNTFIGAMLVFLSGLPQFFEPIQFVISNMRTLGKAALHTFAPLVLAWYVAQVSPVLRDSLFSDPSMLMKLFGAFSLYALASLTWMLGWMFARSIFSGVVAQFSAFEQVGQQQMATRT